MSQYPAESLQSDLIRIRTAMEKLDFCELIQDIAPDEAAQLLREAQEELHRLIAALSPSRSELRKAG